MLNIIIFANFGIIDDHTLLSTLAVGEKIPLSIMPEIGRFFPLNAFELNILDSFFGRNASVFYGFNAIMALVLIVLLYKTLRLFVSGNLAMLLIIVFLCSPAFITAFLRLFVPEKMESVFFGIFLFSYIYFYKSNKIIFAILAICSGSLALYYKEPAFIMLGGFAFFHFIFAFKMTSYKQKCLDLLLMFSSFLWLVAYYIFVIARKTTSGSYGDTPYNPLIVFVKNALNYALSEPFLFIGVFGIALYRIYLILRRKSQINPLLDAMLLSAMLYLLAFLVLNIYSFHYPLPAYIFAIVPLGVYIAVNFKARFIKILIAICAFLYIFNAFPTFLYQLNFYKSYTNNFASTIAFLDKYLEDNPTTNIYLEGVNRASGVEVYHSFGKNISFLGHSDFDLLSDLKIDNEILGKSDESSPYTVFQSHKVIEKQRGDLVVLTPFNTREFSKPQNYELLYEAKFGLNLPLLNIKTMLKFIAIKIFGGNNEVILSSNYLALPIHFSVFRVVE